MTALLLAPDPVVSTGGQPGGSSVVSPGLVFAAAGIWHLDWTGWLRCTSHSWCGLSVGEDQGTQLGHLFSYALASHLPGESIGFLHLIAKYPGQHSKGRTVGGFPASTFCWTQQAKTQPILMGGKTDSFLAVSSGHFLIATPD